MSKLIQKILKEWKKEAGITRAIQFKYRNGVLTIYTSQCGWLIGFHGTLVAKYEKILKEELGDEFNKVEFVETDFYLV